MAYQMLAVGVGWQVYALTSSSLDLGFVGLRQFLPALLLVGVAPFCLSPQNPIAGHKRMICSQSTTQCAGLSASKSQDVHKPTVGKLSLRLREACVYGARGSLMLGCDADPPAAEYARYVPSTTILARCPELVAWCRPHRCPPAR
jgi:hypothetical protein